MRPQLFQASVKPKILEHRLYLSRRSLAVGGMIAMAQRDLLAALDAVVLGGDSQCGGCDRRALQQAHRLEPDIVFGRTKTAHGCNVKNAGIEAAGRIEYAAGAIGEVAEIDIERLGPALDTDDLAFRRHQFAGARLAHFAIPAEPQPAHPVADNGSGGGSRGIDQCLEGVGRVIDIIIKGHHRLCGEVLQRIDQFGVRPDIINKPQLHAVTAKPEHGVGNGIGRNAIGEIDHDPGGADGLEQDRFNGQSQGTEPASSGRATGNQIVARYAGERLQIEQARHLPGLLVDRKIRGVVDEQVNADQPEGQNEDSCKQQTIEFKRQICDHAMPVPD